MFLPAISSIVRLFSASTRTSSHVAGIKALRLAGLAALAATTVMLSSFAQANLLGVQSTVPISGPITPTGIALDGSGNIVFSDGLSILSAPVSGGTPTTLESSGLFGSSVSWNVLNSGATLLFTNGPSVEAADYVGGVFLPPVVVGTAAPPPQVASVPLTTGPEILAVFSNGAGPLQFSARTGGVWTPGILIAGTSTPSSPHSGATTFALLSLSGGGAVLIFEGSDLNFYWTKYLSGAWSAVTPLSTPNVFNLAGSGLGGMALDQSGNLFVTDSVHATIIEYAWVGSTPIDVALGPSYSSAPPTFLQVGANAPTGLVPDNAGSLYVSDTGNGRILKIPLGAHGFPQQPVGTQSSTILTYTFQMFGTLGSIAVLPSAAGLDFANAGTGTCTAGVTYSGPTNDVCTVDVKFTPQRPGPRFGAVDLLNSSGQLLTTALAQGTGVGPQITFANTTTGAFLPAAQGPVGSGFSSPYAVAVDASGNVFVADHDNNAVKEIVAGTGGAAAGTVNASSTVNTVGSGFSSPSGVAVDGSGNVFVADTGNNLVKKIVAGTGGAAAGTLNASSTTGAVGGSGFNQPEGVAVDGNGNIFVADTGHSVMKQLLAGNYATVTLGIGFNHPNGVAVDASGNVFVADAGNGVVKEIVAGTGGAAAGTVNALSTVNTLGSGFNNPNGVSVDASGNVFVADSGNAAVKKIVAGTGGAAAGTVNASSTVNNLTSSGYNNPLGVALDGNGNVFVAATYNNVVEKLDYADPPSLSFGPTFVGSTSLDSPQTVTVSNDGNASLNFATLTYPADFPDSGSGANPCTGTTVLSAGTQCDLGIDFTPQGPGPLSEVVTLTDDSLNTANASQSISVGGPAFPQVSTTTSVAVDDVLTGSGWSGTEIAGASAYATAIVSPGGPGPLPTGTVTYTLSAGGGCSGSITTATVSVSSGFVPNSSAFGPLAAGTYSLSAKYSGDSVYLQSSSACSPFSVAAFTPPQLTAPAPGSTLPGSSATFTWNPGNATNFEFRLGTVLGANDVFSSLPTTLTSFNVTTLPTNGLTLYARLYYMVNGVYQAIDYTYLEAGAPTPPTLLTPSPLTSSTVTFSWDPGTAKKFQFRLGTVLGAKDVYGSGQTTNTSVTVNGLPTNGLTLYARLYYLVNGAWQHIDRTYIESGTPTPPTLLTPAPTSTLSAAPVTFTWDPGTATTFQFRLGTALGSNNLYSSGQTTQTSVTVNTLPTDGSPIHARLYYKVNGAWQHIDYLYTAQ